MLYINDQVSKSYISYTDGTIENQFNKRHTGKSTSFLTESNH